MAIAVSFSQYWKACTNVMDRIPPRDDVGDDDAADRQWANPNRHAEQGFQRQTGALILRHQVEHADHDDDQHRDLAQPRRAEPELREVRHGVCARPAQRRGDEQQQAQIAGGEADRIPQRVGAVLGDQPGDAEKRCGREVFPGDGRGVPLRADAARGDEEIGCGAGQPNPVAPIATVATAAASNAAAVNGEPVMARSSTTPTKSRSPCSASRTYSRPTPYRSGYTSTASTSQFNRMPSTVTAPSSGKTALSNGIAPTVQITTAASRSASPSCARTRPRTRASPT